MSKWNGWLDLVSNDCEAFISLHTSEHNAMKKSLLYPKELSKYSVILWRLQQNIASNTKRGQNGKTDPECPFSALEISASKLSIFSPTIVRELSAKVAERLHYVRFRWRTLPAQESLTLLSVWIQYCATNLHVLQRRAVHFGEIFTQKQNQSQKIRKGTLGKWF